MAKDKSLRIKVQTTGTRKATKQVRGLTTAFRGAGAAAGYTQIIGHAYFGMAVLEQARIVGIVTDN